MDVCVLDIAVLEDLGVVLDMAYGHMLVVEVGWLVLLELSGIVLCACFSYPTYCVNFSSTCHIV